jgi:3-dehydroquinate synthase
MSHTYYSISNQPHILLRDFFANRHYSQVAVLTDVNTKSLCYPLIKNSLPAHTVIELSAGEENKNLDTCTVVWQTLTNLNFDRQSLLLILGGGVLGDLGGFCAATFKRGIDFVVMPTTLLAQVDASIGGKLGIDFNHFKNHIGLFQNPVTTLISPVFLQTLSARELRSGFAEIIKHCLISDSKMWDIIRAKSLEQQDWNTLIPHSADFKIRIIEQDPLEKDVRKTLNFGHTIGHGVESYFLKEGNRIFHGEAIAIGMIAESFIARQKGLITNNDLEQISRYVLQIFGKNNNLPGTAAILKLIYQDKKNIGNRILMALTKGLGQAVWGVEVKEDEIESALSYYNSL